MKIFGVTGWKNSGKTGLMERLVAHFTAQGLRVSTLKHTHHGVDLEKPGTDTHRHRVAGAQEVVLVSSARIATLHELRDDPEPRLAELIKGLKPCVDSFGREEKNSLIIEKKKKKHYIISRLIGCSRG